MCDFRFKDLSSIDCNLPTGCQQFVDFESSCHLEPSDNRKHVCVRMLVGHHFLWKVNESFSLKIVYERVMIRTLLGTLHPKGMGGIMSCWTITKRRTRIYRIVFFFFNEGKSLWEYPGKQDISYPGTRRFLLPFS